MRSEMDPKLPMISPIALDTYSIAMMSPVTTMKTTGHLFNALSLTSWLFLAIATLFVGWASIRVKPKTNKVRSLSDSKPGITKKIRNGHIFDLIFHLLGQWQKSLSRQRMVKSSLALACVMFGLTTIRYLISERMFSQFTLKESHWINSFSELLTRNDIKPVYHSNFVRNVKKLKLTKLESLINKNAVYHGNHSRQLPFFMSQSNYVFLADMLQIERFFQANQGMPLKIADDRINFELKAKFPILTKNLSKLSVQKLKKW